MQNIGDDSANSSFQIRYEIKGPETGGAWKLIADSMFNAVPLEPGADQQYSTEDKFAQAPSTEGNYTLRACLDSASVITESDEGNNCTELTIYVSPSATPSLKPVYRFRNLVTSAYFYTASEEEKDMVIKMWPYLWRYQHIEHCAFSTQEAGSVPVYRFRADNAFGTSYFYTASEIEKDYVISELSYLWKYQGVAWYAYDHEDSSMNTLPVYRFRADTSEGTFYFYTASESERDYVISDFSYLWKYNQGIAWYGFECP